MQVVLHAEAEAHTSAPLQALLVATQVCETPSQAEVFSVEPEHESGAQDVAAGV